MKTSNTVEQMGKLVDPVEGKADLLRLRIANGTATREELIAETKRQNEEQRAKWSDIGKKANATRRHRRGDFDPENIAKAAEAKAARAAEIHQMKLNKVDKAREASNVYYHLRRQELEGIGLLPRGRVRHPMPEDMRDSFKPVLPQWVRDTLGDTYVSMRVSRSVALSSLVQVRLVDLLADCDFLWKCSLIQFPQLSKFGETLQNYVSDTLQAAGCDEDNIGKWRRDWFHSAVRGTHGRFQWYYRTVTRPAAKLYDRKNNEARKALGLPPRQHKYHKAAAARDKAFHAELQRQMDEL